jgi:hypothetical protein
MLHIKFFTKFLKSTQINRVVKVNSSLCILPGRQYNKKFGAKMGLIRKNVLVELEIQ